MATTQKGIYYPDDYSKVADIPADMEDMANSIDTIIQRIDEEDSTQDSNISDLQTIVTNQNIEIQTLQEDLNNSTLTILGTGENVTLNNTAKGSFKTPPYPQGNSTQNGTPTPSSPVAIKSAGDNDSINITISNSDNTITQTKTIPVQEPFRSIGNVKDCFIKQDGVWYEKHFIGKYVATGNEQVTKSSASTSIDRFFFTIFNENTIDKNVGISSHFRYGYNTLNTFHYDLYDSTYNRVFCDFSNYGENTVQSFKTWLSENNPEFYYVLLTPTLTQCTSAQTIILEQLEKSTSYKGTTHIYCTDETSPYFEVEARGDLNLIINNL